MRTSHARRRHALAQDSHRREAVEPWHDEVEHDHVRVEKRGHLDRLAPVRCLADDLDAFLELEEGAQPFADDRVVVGDQDADRLSHRRAPASPSFPARARS